MQTPSKRRRVSGPRIVFSGLVLVVLVATFVVVRMIQVSGPGPDPSTIPQRPTTTP